MLGWLADPERLRRYAGGDPLLGARSGCSPPRTGRWTTEGLTIADIALLDELDALLGKPVRPKPGPRGTRTSSPVACAS